VPLYAAGISEHTHAIPTEMRTSSLETNLRKAFTRR
jgi:hypothetical protein